MGNVINFDEYNDGQIGIKEVIEKADKKLSEESKGPEMNPEDLKTLINENELIKVCLRVMNDLDAKVSEDEIEPDYMELWNNIALNKKIEIEGLNAGMLDYYYQLMHCGYDNFGIDFFRHMSSQLNYPYLSYGIVSLLTTVDLSQETIKNQQEIIEDLKNKLANSNK